MPLLLGIAMTLLSRRRAIVMRLAKDNANARVTAAMVRPTTMLMHCRRRLLQQSPSPTPRPLASSLYFLFLCLPPSSRYRLVPSPLLRRRRILTLSCLATPAPPSPPPSAVLRPRGRCCRRPALPLLAPQCCGGTLWRAVWRAFAVSTTVVGAMGAWRLRLECPKGVRQQQQLAEELAAAAAGELTLLPLAARLCAADALRLFSERAKRAKPPSRGHLTISLLATTAAAVLFLLGKLLAPRRPTLHPPPSGNSLRPFPKPTTSAAEVKRKKGRGHLCMFSHQSRRRRSPFLPYTSSQTQQSRPSAIGWRATRFGPPMKLRREARWRGRRLLPHYWVLLLSLRKKSFLLLLRSVCDRLRLF